MALVELIGVAFDGSGRSNGQARAPAELRSAGLAAALPAGKVGHDVTGPPADPSRGPSGFFNERALLAMSEAVDLRVGEALHEGRFPVLYGGDCAVLLGAIPALRDEAGRAGLLFIDAHEDATPLETSTTGEAANMELALLLGLSTPPSKTRLAGRLPALDPQGIVMLGQRDQRYREKIPVETIADRVRLHPVDELRAQLEDLVGQSVAHLERRTSAWWVHIDLDVLSGDEFAACGAATDPATPGGLTWQELTTVARIALGGRACRGLSIGVYNTDLDPKRSAAHRIVRFIGDIAVSVEGPAQ